MPKRKKRTVAKKKKDDSPDEVSECESLDRPPSAKKVAAASSTSQLDDEMDQISTYSAITLPVSGGQTLLICGYCSFTAETKRELGAHTRQHMTKCPHCSFSSFKHSEVNRHCKDVHDKDIDAVTSEVDSSSTEWEMDTDPCIACVFCSFMTYSTDHLVKHTAHKHPGMIAKSVAKMITKQVSACVRKDDYLFYLIISSESGAVGQGHSSIAADKSSDPILIDVCVDKTVDVKPEVKDTHDNKSFQQKLPLIDSVKVSSDRNTLPDGDKSSNGDTLISSSLRAPIKVETMHCLTCPYNNVYIEKMKCHTIVRHPVGAAATTYNSTGESSDAQDATFFCVREDCNHNSSDCSTYQKHLMDCCSNQKTLKVLERERLRSTITFILEYQRKCKLTAVEGFFDFASPFLGFSLPPSLTGISLLRTAEVPTAKQTKVERNVTSPESSVVNTEKTPSVNSIPTTSISYKTQSNLLASTTVSSSGSQNTGSRPSLVNQSNLPQQFQDITSNVQLTGNNNRNYDSKIFNSSDSINMPVQVSSTNIPSEERISQSDQNYNNQTFVPFHAQNQGDFLQPSQRSFQEKPQMNVNWTSSNEREPSNMISVPAQSQQNFNMAFHNHHIETGSRPVSQDNTACSPSVSQSKPESLSMASNINVDRSFPTVPTPNNYAPTFRHSSLDSTNTSYMNANIGHNLGIEHHEAASATIVSNPITNLAYYEQQEPGSVFNTADVETQPQPKMLDLLSDSYSILLSEEFGPEGQLTELGTNNLTQTDQTPLCPPSYHQAPVINTQSQAVISQPPSLMPPGHSTIYPPMQQEEPSFQQPLVDNSFMISHENQFSFSQSNQESQMVSVMPNLGSDSGLQAVQSSSSYGPAQNTLAPETVCSQPVPHQPQSVPNFLVSPGGPSSVSPGGPSSVATPVHQHTTASFFNSRQNSGQPTAVQPAPFTPPKNPNTVNRFAGASPLSPSIYLSGHSPRHSKSSWTNADMRPRGMMLPAVSPRNIHAPVTSPVTKSQVNQRLFDPVKRGYPRPPRMPSGRGRMSAPRMLNNRASGGGDDDDDDVIVTAVTRCPPPGKQQPGGRIAVRGSPGSMSKGREHPVPAHHQQRGSVPGVRMPYPASPLQQPPKQFDISKHFEDLACVVNASTDEVGNDNDIEIVCVTPGDKNKSGQSKAVDANKFSFCCVHCGKDQGSKKVMKQHMKARHNDSLLGAFTNTETGQLLFFCPQLTCEFMTYDEKRLCEHLPKCFDLDRSKPFDFGTAIKNLKSLKIRQLDVRTMGRSQDNPIDLDGQGMKDNFSSSLNDAFGDIVVNASGRHIVRNSTIPPQTPPKSIRPSSMPTNHETIRNKIPFRNQAPGSIGPRLRHPRFTERVDIRNRFPMPAPTFRHPRYQNPEIHANNRQTAPTNIRMNASNVRDTHPKSPASAEHHQSPIMRATTSSHASTPRQPSGGRHDPVVIVINVDSPEKPEEMEHNDYEQGGTHIISNKTHVGMSNVNISESLRADIPTENRNTNISQKHSEGNPNLMFSQSMQNSSSWNLPREDSRMTTEQTPAFLQQTYQSSNNARIGNNSIYEMDQVSTRVQQNSVNLSDSVSCSATGLTSISSSHMGIQASQTASLDSSASGTSSKSNTSSYSAADGPFATNTVAGSSDSDQQVTTCSSTDRSFDAPTIKPSATLPTNLNTVSMAECFDEEERVNAVVLEKVFAKVPNMPKNLSRRLVAKFKEYAHYRGVKISSDSKVIDEFVSKIYYKGSTTDKTSTKTQPALHSAPLHHQENSENTHIEGAISSLPPRKNATNQADCEYVSSRETTEGHREESMHTNVRLKEKAEEHQTIVKEDPSTQTAENDVITTKVILAQTNLQFTPTFARIALKSLTTAKTEIQQDMGQDQHKPTVTEQKIIYPPFKSDVTDFTSTTIRRNSASDVQLTKIVNPIRRYSSLPVPPSATARPEAVKPERLPTAASPPYSASHTKNQDDMSLVFPEVKTSESHPQKDYEIISQKESKTQFPAALNSDSVPIVITSCVEDIVLGHPALEIDIAGRPCKEEQLDEGCKELNIDCKNTVQKANDNFDQVKKTSEVFYQSNLANEDIDQTLIDINVGLVKKTSEDFDQAGKSSEDFDQAGKTSEDFDQAGKTSEDFDQTERASEDFDQAEKASEDFDHAGKSSEDFDQAEKEASKDFDLTGKSSEDFDQAEKASEDFDQAGKSSEDFDQAEKASEDFDHAGKSSEDLDQAEKASEDFDHAKNKTEEIDQAKKTNEVISQVLPKKARRFGLIKKLKFPDIIDKKTGMLQLKSRKPFIKRKETPDNIKDSLGEETFVRRSSRSRKPVNKDYQGETNEMDDLMSDDDDEYNINEEDDGTDTDNEWRGGNSDQQPPRKRMKKVASPPDPTAFDVTTKGKFKCWMCKKIFSRCSFAKSHITQKHKSGLCAIHLDKSEELKTLCLLLFCSRKCKYITLSLEALKSHMENCSQPLLQDGENYLEINKQFLENTFSELQSLSLEAMLNKTKTRKPKDPTKPVKAKKPKVKEDKLAMDKVVIKFRKASVDGEGGNVLVSSIVPHTFSSNTAPIISAGNSQAASSGGVILPEDNPTMGKQPRRLTDPGKLSQTKMQCQQNLHHSTQVQRHYSTTLVPERASSHFPHMTSSLSMPANASGSNPSRQQTFATGKQTHASSSFSQHPVLPHVATSSPMHDDDFVYVIEDNGTICLK